MAQAWPGGSVAWRRDINSSWPKLGPVDQLQRKTNGKKEGRILTDRASFRYFSLLSVLCPGHSVGGHCTDGLIMNIDLFQYVLL